MPRKTIFSGHDQYLDLKGLSKYSRLGVSTLRDHIKTKGLPCFKVKGKILVRKSEFDDWMEQFRVRKDKDIDRIVDEAVASLRK